MYGDGGVKLTSRMEDFNGDVIRKILNFEIQYTIRKLNRLKNEQDSIMNGLRNVCGNIKNEFRLRQRTLYNKKFQVIKQSNIQKMARLIETQYVDIRVQDTWIRNLTEVPIPGDIANMLALGPKFALPVTRDEIPIRKLLAEVEQLVSKVDEDKKNLYRAKVTNVITNYLVKGTSEPAHLHSEFNKAKRFLNQHKDMIILQSDKGGTTVVINKDEYDEKMMQILGDAASFRALNNDPTNSIQSKSNKLINELEEKKVLTPEEAKKFRKYNTTCPKIYGNPKLHKEGIPLRPIVSGINGPTQVIAKFTAEILDRAYDKQNEYYTGDTFKFTEFMKNRTIPQNYKVISLDVVNLFGNITKELVRKTLERKWDDIKDHARGLEREEFWRLVQFVLDNNVFSYNQICYRQILGCAMGSELSPILAQYVMDALMEECIPGLSYQLPFIKKFVDDLVTAVPGDGINEILQVFNSYDIHLNFTVEQEDERCSVPFLDTRIVRVDGGRLLLDWYQKKTSSGRYINYHSRHSMRIKVNFIKGMKKRITAISDQQYYHSNLKKLESILVKNSYPKTLVRNLLYSTSTGGSPLGEDSIEAAVNLNVNIEEMRYGVLMDIPGLTNNIINIFRREDVKIARRKIKTVGELYTKLKDKTPTLLQANVIYRLQCEDCNKYYVGQTSQRLKNRIGGHKSDCKYHPERCMLAAHVNEYDHKINYDDVKILDIEPNYHKRSFLEMYHIKKTQPVMNKRSDIQDLSVLYTYLMELDNHGHNNLDTLYEEAITF